MHSKLFWKLGQPFGTYFPSNMNEKIQDIIKGDVFMSLGNVKCSIICRMPATYIFTLWD